MRRWLVFLLLILFALSAATSQAADRDRDDDGLSDEQEAILGTDPADPDTDGDGLPDGEEYFVRFTDPTRSDSDEDGLSDKEDKFPTWLRYEDLNGVTTSTDRLLNTEEGLTLHQLVQVKVGNVITIDWYNHLTEEFTLGGADFTISFDFIDPNRQDYAGDGFYRIGPEGDTVEVLLPSYRGVLDVTVPWRQPTMTISDWPYHLFSKEIEEGQTWDFFVFYHEFLAQGEDPFFTGHAEVIGTETLPLDSRLGRRDYEVYVVVARLEHVTFNDPYFKEFLGPDPVLNTRVLISKESGVILRYTTPFFRITPSKQFNFSDFIVVH